MDRNGIIVIMLIEKCMKDVLNVITVYNIACNLNKNQWIQIFKFCSYDANDGFCLGALAAKI